MRFRVRAKLRHVLGAMVSKIGNAVAPFMPVPELDLVFVVPQAQRGWILEGIAGEIARYFSGRHAFHYGLTGLPTAKAYFFMHYATVGPVRLRNPVLWGRKLFVWYTHPREDLGLSQLEIVSILNRAERIFCTCSQFVSLLENQGVESRKLSFVLGGADPTLFHSHERGEGRVGFCTAYYPRKAPDTILDLVKLMPNQDFLLVGRDWQNWERYEEMLALPNLEYVEASYDRYPELYARMDVLVSPALLEGGPIPLIEAMMSNVVPVASRTGFAPDIIRQGENGFLFDVGSDAAVIRPLVEAALGLRADIRATVLAYSWENFARQIEALMAFDFPATRKLVEAGAFQSTLTEQ